MDLAKNKEKALVIITGIVDQAHDLQAYIADECTYLEESSLEQINSYLYSLHALVRIMKFKYGEKGGE